MNEVIIAMFIHNILNRKGSYVATVAPDAPVIDVLEALNFENLSALIISHDGLKAVGIISKGDIVRGLYDFGRKIFDLEVGDLMTKSVVSCRPQDTIASVVAQMWRHKIQQLPVVDGKILAGLVSHYDILHHRYWRMETERETRTSGFAARKPTTGMYIDQE